jgi:hypothetical protein
MATRVAAAGGGNWTTGGTWVGGVAPTAADDAQIPATAGNITIDSGAVCRSADFSTYTGTVTHTAGVTWTIGDGTAGLSNIAMKMVAGMTYTLGNATTSAISFISTSATVQTVDFAGKATANVTFNATSNGSWQYTGGQTPGSSFSTTTLTKGSLNLNGQTVSFGLFDSSNSNIRSLTLGAANVTCTSSNGNIWNTGTATNLTLSAASSTITLSGSAATFQGGAQTFGTLVLSGAAVAVIGGANTFGALTRTGTATKTDGLTLNANQTVSGTLTISSDSAVNRLVIQSNTVGTARTITAASVVATNIVDFQDITGAGAATWTVAGTGATALGNCGGNSGITFTTPATQTWSGTSGGNWSANAWSGRVPLPQDDVVISAAFVAAQTVTNDMPRLGASISWTGATGTPTWATGASAFASFGSVTLAAGMTMSGTAAHTLRGRSSYTITTAGNTWSTSMLTVDNVSGTYTLADDFAGTTSTTLKMDSGNIASGNFAISAQLFQSNSANTRSANFGTSIITLTGVTNLWNVNNAGLTLTASAATLIVGTANPGARTMSLSTHTYGTITYTVAGSTGSLTLSGACTIGTINFSDITNARTLTFTAGTTTTFTGTFNVQGTAGKLMTINSSSGGSAATISKASGTVSCDYLSIQDSTATGGATWYAGANSTNVSGNTGWIFTAAPVAPVASGGGNSTMSYLGIASLARL